MPTCDYSTFFSTAIGSDLQPYGYQSRLAELPCESRLISVPTGLGKTAAVVLAWLWNRHCKAALTLGVADSSWPRRLVYCLPMRTLVEQTASEARKWLENLVAAGLLQHRPQVRILMGGEEAGEWDIYPEREAILIGTQDMLLSRALNRGYGMSRYRWPMHFGLLNNDSLWVLDETQLMGVAVETSAQLDGLRKSDEWSFSGVGATWWMSATLDACRLGTVDHSEPSGGWPMIALEEHERNVGGVRMRYEAPKPLSKASVALSSVEKKNYARQIAALVKERHQPGSLTLVVVNRVSRAQEIYAALQDRRLQLNPDCLALIHSRFRPEDRDRHTAILLGSGDRIVVATQAVEAGVDVSARLLVTELAPWSSLVQRFGRCNRAGCEADAEVLWIDVQAKDDKDDVCLPYANDDLGKARAALEQLPDGSSKSLEAASVPEPIVIRPVLRRRDLIDLFDTTPDLCGQDLDISRYIRDGEDTDVQFLWRHVDTDIRKEQDLPCEPRELCRVSIADAAKFFKKDTIRASQWNPLTEKWEKANRPRAGAVYLLDVASGGYSEGAGWTGNPKDVPFPLPSPRGALEAYGRDSDSFLPTWQTLEEHTAAVVLSTATLCQGLGVEPVFARALHTAALWHDVGKAHVLFQKMLCGEESGRAGTLWAKSANVGGRCERRGFRHELASALAWLLAGPADEPERDLVAYLVAAHHGKVRLSLRALPQEQGPPGEDGRPFARGVWDGDTLPAVSLGAMLTPPVTLDLGFMQMGTGQHGESWLSRTIALRDRLGPFRLAYLETLLRAADATASRD